MSRKSVHGFQTGDVVIATVPTEKHQGTHVGRIAVRASGRFNLHTEEVLRQGVSWKHCRLLHRNDGYSYHTYSIDRQEARIPPRLERRGLLRKLG